jgi:hypothetical protein
MKNLPSWLPEMVSCDGEWNRVLISLYRIFEKDFKENKRLFEGKPVWWDKRVLKGEKYEEGFWHLVSKDTGYSGRVPDFRRAERLPWCGPTITHSEDTWVKVWDYLEGIGRLRTYLWLEEWNYVIVLEKRKLEKGEIAFLVTAFYVDGESSRRNLRKKYHRRAG